MIQWPTDIPLPLIDYTGGVRNSTIRSNEGGGYLYRRRRAVRNYHDLNVSWALTPAQYVAFKEFFETTVSNGASQFAVELRFPKNTVLTDWVVRFTGGHEDTYNEGIWDVSAGIETLREVTTPALAGPMGYSAFIVTGDLHFTVTGDFGYYVQDN